MKLSVGICSVLQHEIPNSDAIFEFFRYGIWVMNGENRLNCKLILHDQ